MADTYYAWSPIHYGMEGNRPKVVKAGERITRAKLDITEEDWEELVASGAVRRQRYPDIPKGYTDSPVNFLRNRVREAELGVALSEATEEDLGEAQ